MKNDLPVERLREVFAYDPDTGALRWKVTCSNVAVAGSVAGSPGSEIPALYVGLDGHKHRVSRVIWAIQTGAWPVVLVDHADGEPLNNRWANLRLADDAQNCANQKIRSTNTSGFKGVSKARRKWRACIVVDGKQQWLGSYQTAGEAGEAYRLKAEELHGDFALSRSRSGPGRVVTP